jgi:hypothetical protein
MEEIKAILTKYDIAAVVVLHEPSFIEYLSKIDPSYSCASFVEGGIRVRAKKEDFDGDEEVRNQKLKDTANMLHNLAKGTATVSLPLIDTSEAVDKFLGSRHYGGDHTSHTQQNN